MKDLVLLSLPDVVDANPLMYFPLSLTYLGAVATKAGYDVEIVDCRDGVKPLPEARFYGFSCATPQINLAKEWAHKLKGETIIGGAHSSLLPNDCVKHFDYVVRGEGEYVLLEILEGKRPKGIVQADRITNLDAVPYPAWDMVSNPFSDTLFPGERYGKGELAATLIGSRGCPFACSFCLPKNTKILTKKLEWKNIQDIQQGEIIIGTDKENKLIGTIVLNTFKRKAMVYAIETKNGTVFSTEEHPWLMHNGFKSIKNIKDSQKYNASFNSERAVLRKVSTPQELLPETELYKKGYLSGAMCGDGHISFRKHIRPYGKKMYQYWRITLTGDYEMLYRALDYSHSLGLNTVHIRKFNGGKIYKNVDKQLVCDTSEQSAIIKDYIDMSNPDLEYKRGFLSGIYDAEGCYSNALKICNNDIELKERIISYLHVFGFKGSIKKRHINLLGGRAEAIRFLSLVQPCVTNKKLGWDGSRIKNSSKIIRVYPVGEQDVYNLQTTVETFIADGFVTHNCGNIHTRPVIFRSANNILGEIEELMKRGVKHFRFEDDCFTILPQFNQLMLGLTTLGVKYKAHTRSNLITQEKADLMWASGCEECGLGVESADDDVLELNNKHLTAEDHTEAIRIIKKAKMRSKAYWVMGLPGETDKTLELNKRFVVETQIDKWTISTFQPYPGCPVFKSPGKFGIEIINMDFSKWWNYSDRYNHILIGQTHKQMWDRYKAFYTFLKDERNWRK